MIVPFNPFEFHHLYFGIIGVAVSIAVLNKKKLGHWWTIFWGIVCWLSLITTIDDISQHWINGESVVNVLFHWVWAKVFGQWWPFGNF